MGNLGTPIELTLAAFVGLPILVVVLECLSMVMELDVNSEDENKNKNKKESPLYLLSNEKKTNDFLGC